MPEKCSKDKAISASDHQLYFISFLEKTPINNKTINFILHGSPRIFLNHDFFFSIHPLRSQITNCILLNSPCFGFHCSKDKAISPSDRQLTFEQATSKGISSSLLKPLSQIYQLKDIKNHEKTPIKSTIRKKQEMNHQKPKVSEIICSSVLKP